MPRPRNTPAALKVACVDFETYYDDSCSVTTLGIRKYMEHPDFDPYLVAIHGDGIEYVGEPAAFDWAKLDGYQIIAHNASFDEAIFQFWGKPRWCKSWRTQLPWQCTADLSAFLGLGRSLKDAAKHGLGIEVAKTVRKQMKGQKWSTLDAATRAEWMAYAGEDARLSYLLWKANADKWPDTERTLSMLTRRMGWRGLAVDQDLITENTCILRAKTQDLLKQIPFVDENTTPAARKKFNEACEAAGVPPPSTRAQKSEEWAKWLETYGEKVPWAPAVADYQRVNRALKLYETLSARVLSSGRFSYDKKYMGAHTGRWAGGGGFNLENLARDPLHGTDIRNVFIAKPGHVLVSSDLSQIEPRVLAWRAGETDFLDLCRQGISPYVAHGLMTNRIQDKDAFEKERKVKGSDAALTYSGIKAEVLLLGYGGGAETFMRSAGVYGINTDLLNAKRIVDSFRASRPKVPQLWRELERDWKMRYSCGANPIELPLPSGRCLRYFHPRVHEREAHARTSLDARFPSKVYGGLLTENCFSGDTIILTPYGFSRMDDLSHDVPVWDGVEWVHHDGTISKGEAPVVDFGGVHVTPDHRVQVNGSWVQVKDTSYEEATSSCGRHYRTPKWVHRRREIRRLGRTKVLLDIPMRLRKAGEESRFRFQKRELQIMRMPDRGNDCAEPNHTWHEPSSRVRRLVEHVRPLSVAHAPSMGELRGPRNYRLPEVAGEFREFLGRHGTQIPQRTDVGSTGQLLGIFSRELCVAKLRRTGSEQTRQRDHSDSGRRATVVESCASVGTRPNHTSVQEIRGMPGSADVRSPGFSQPVFDIVNCGPRNQFMVFGKDGRGFIAHNCIQAVARDVLADMLLRLSTVDWLTPLMTVHDEILFEVPDYRADEALEIVTREMSTPPAWASDLPVDCSGEQIECYTK